MANPLVAFHSGTGRDHASRTLEEVLAFTDDELERTHDYIQWLFPLFEESGAAPDSPVLDSESAAEFRRNATMQRNMHRAFDMMLRFYGLALDADAAHPAITPTSTFPARARVWLTPFNHNFLRLTRIMKCLSIVGASDLARALLACLERIDRESPGIIGPTTLRYWRGAVPA